MNQAMVVAEIEHVGAGPSGHDSETSNPFSELYNLFLPRASCVTGHGTPSTSGERAPKRRKLQNNTRLGTASQNFDESKSVVLARVVLQLHPSVGDVGKSGRLDGAQMPENSLEVTLDSFSCPIRDEPAGVESPDSSVAQFVVSISGVNVRASAAPDTLNALEAHLKTVASLDNRRSRSRVAFSRCLLSPPSWGRSYFTLTADIRWMLDLSLADYHGQRLVLPHGKSELRLFNRYVPEKEIEDDGDKASWTISSFYDSVHVPPVDMEIPPQIQQSLPESKLYPFQRRAVEWLLRREGVEYPPTGGPLRPIPEKAPLGPLSFRAIEDLDGRKVYINNLIGLISSNPSNANSASSTLRGGILAEEMGLGKTVEVIALIRQHKRKITQDNVYDPYTGTYVQASGATLIICPPSLLEQWKSEINAHAPDLRVMHYEGIFLSSQKKLSEATVDNLMQYDVVLTTYAVLSREIHYARPPPDRSLRHQKRHEARRSPLIQISWWRVCLDEAQMVEKDVSQAATVARIIPRCNAWAVSGTPLRQQVSDLRGLLTFLRYEPFASSHSVWDRLDKSTFRAIFNQIALRHTKDKVREELRLPPQKRIVITVPFTAIEEQNYSEMVRQMCEACGFTPEGVPVEDRRVDDKEVLERMREWLMRLRQTCLHAQVGRRNRRALGARNGPLRTVDEVLEVMIDQNDTLKKAEAREFILALLRQGLVVGNARDDEKRSVTALEYHQVALEQAQKWVKFCREEIAEEKKKVGTPAIDETDLSDEDVEGASLGRVSALRKFLRTFLLLEHACKFFIGSAYYQIKSNESLTKPDSEDFHRLEELEVKSYDEAKAIRKELLRETQYRAQLQMKKIRSKDPFYRLPEIPQLPDQGGIEGKKILDMMDIICDLLNAQATQLEKWRRKIVEILLLPLVDEDEGLETTGEEYENSTKVQDELYVYIMALRTLVADRSALVTGLHDALVNHEIKQAEMQALQKEGDRGHAPELLLEIVSLRRNLQPRQGMGSLKGAVSAARSLLTSLQWKADTGDDRAVFESAIVQKQLLEIQKIATDEAKAIAELEKEQELFRGAMNQRLEFYRQLQHISDTVAPWKEELDPTRDETAFVQQQHFAEKHKKCLADCIAKHNYLTHLRAMNENPGAVHECTICKEEFEIGVLTSCGHEFCKECIKIWWHAHRTCPVCKVRLHTADFTDITFNPRTIEAQEENHGSGSPSLASTPADCATSIYSGISESTMKEIRMVDLEGSYGTKIDTLARHLLWIRNNDPGAKSIIFSQFGDFLEVLGDALKRWKIGCTSIREKNGISRFRSDPAVECFLLDAKSDSSGLTLVNATYVFLCEPLINPAIELQAIARVHRIGQKRQTTVFMYLVKDTVEETIYDISVARRLEHMAGAAKPGSGRNTPAPALQEKMLDAANSMELESAPLKGLLRKKGDGEVVQTDDLWRCLFGKVRTNRGMLDQEMGRHLRAEAAEARIAQAET